MSASLSCGYHTDRMWRRGLLVLGLGAGLVQCGSGVGVLQATAVGGGAGHAGANSGGEGAPFDAGVGGSAVKVEDCGNGEDDDGNGLIDCLDPACSDHHCLPAAPPGWKGPVAMHFGDDPELPCPEAWPTLSILAGVGPLDAPDATCSPCSCKQPTSVKCTKFKLDWYQQLDCQGPSGLTGLFESSCATWHMWKSFKVGWTGSNATCKSDGGVPTIPPATYPEHLLLCDAKGLGAGCAEPDEVCVPAGDTPQWTRRCIHRVGDAACPDGPYTERYFGHWSSYDSRDCSPCKCEPMGWDGCEIAVMPACGATPLAVQAPDPDICFDAGHIGPSVSGE